MPDPRFPFSNFQKLSVLIMDGRYSDLLYGTVEHAYQAYKTTNYDERVQIAHAPTPGYAKRLGKRVLIREGWGEMKILVMERLLRHKFTKCPEHRASLIAHRGTIVELNTWHDNFWGSCTCPRCGNRGKNILGTVIKTIRDDIIDGGDHVP
jgi:ribA/ribD-fused uncharacterized protein